jgi:adenylate cyclase class 2
MPLEIEVKFPAPEPEDVRSRLRQLGAGFLDRHFERNSVLDDADSTLRDRGWLLRLRRADKCLLTLKQPPDERSGKSTARPAKVLMETEVQADDCEAMNRILSALGYRKVFAYEKVREKWRHETVLVCLDELCFGTYVELEGEEDAIYRLAPKLGFDPGQALEATYLDLWREHQASTGQALGDSFVFGTKARKRIEAEFSPIGPASRELPSV